MTRKKFIEILDKKRHRYEIVGNKIVVTAKEAVWGAVWLDSLKTIPPDVEFTNGGNVHLNSLKTLPPGVEFGNGGDVYLQSLETIPPGVGFNNGRDVDLRSLKTIPPDVKFENGVDVRLDLLMGKWAGWFRDWSGNIEDIEPNRLFNKMIADGLFDRR